MAHKTPGSGVGAVVRDARVTAYQSAILDAAEQVFVETGFESAKMEDVARVAGVAKGTLYNYFASKEAIFSAVADRWREQLVAMMDSALTHAPVGDRLRTFVYGVLELIERGARMATVYMHATRYSLDSELDPQAREGRRLVADRLSKVLRPLYESGELRNDIPLHQLVVMLGGLLGATIQQYFERGEQAQLTAATDSILAVFLEGALSR